METGMEKILDVLKAGTWAALGLALACAGIIVGLSNGLIPTPDVTLVFSVWALCFLGGSLFITGALRAFCDWMKPGAFLVRCRNKSIRNDQLERYLDNFTEEDRKIVAYLLHHNQRAFSGAGDGGYARVLVAQGFIDRAVRPGYMLDHENTPFVVNDEAWKVLVKHRNRFPFTGNAETTHPWRVPWQIR